MDVMNGLLPLFLTQGIPDSKAEKIHEDESEKT